MYVGWMYDRNNMETVISSMYDTIKLRPGKYGQTEHDREKEGVE